MAAIKCKNVVKFDGVSFNREWILSFKSEQDFAKAQSAKRFFKGQSQEGKLKELWKAATAQADAEAKAKADKAAAKAAPAAPEAK